VIFTALPWHPTPKITQRTQNTQTKPNLRGGNDNGVADSTAGNGHLIDMVAELWLLNQVRAGLLWLKLHAIRQQETAVLRCAPTKI